MECPEAQTLPMLHVFTRSRGFRPQVSCSRTKHSDLRSAYPQRSMPWVSVLQLTLYGREAASIARQT